MKLCSERIEMTLGEYVFVQFFTKHFDTVVDLCRKKKQNIDERKPKTVENKIK